MPGQDHPDYTPEAADSPGSQTRRTGLSRRSLLRRGGLVGAAGLAVAAGGGSLAAVASSGSSGGKGAQLDSAAKHRGPIVVYITDPTSGEMEIFAGTGKTTRRNHTMANWAISNAPR
jgi:hypothetical protein